MRSEISCTALPVAMPSRFDEITTWRCRLKRSIVFGHITGDDPRPHYAHQSNLADYDPNLGETNPAQGGILRGELDRRVAGGLAVMSLVGKRRIEELGPRRAEQLRGALQTQHPQPVVVHGPPSSVGRGIGKTRWEQSADAVVI